MTVTSELQPRGFYSPWKRGEREKRREEAKKNDTERESERQKDRHRDTQRERELKTNGMALEM